MRWLVFSKKTRSSHKKTPNKDSADVSPGPQTPNHSGNQIAGETEEEAMTAKGAQMIIESLSMRVFQIEEAKERLDEEKESLQARIRELEQIRDADVIRPTAIVNIG